MDAQRNAIHIDQNKHKITFQIADNKVGWKEKQIRIDRHYRDNKQGVRQGGVLSTFLCKIYNNTLLKDLQKHNLGFSIGNTYVGCPTCADDIALLSDDSNELQCMISLNRHSMQARVSIHPTKTKAVILNKTRAITKSTLKWTSGESEICPTNQAVHLGIIRSEMKEN